jgi:hypothetical protein
VQEHEREAFIGVLNDIYGRLVYLSSLAAAKNDTNARELLRSLIEDANRLLDYFSHPAKAKGQDV